ncbi:MAG: DUF2169 domain-containing protein, partial [Deltaproteobacteria bacterium]|nr:DUF2169 domain-containing protein [Deltaproteobacteria bacterium]MBW2537405.1 DUF2169 domain-containing protein [Deltaproteobacteria bacterium]
MTSSSEWPVAVAPVGPVAMGSLLWRAHGKLNAAVFVKASFALVPDGAMAPVEPQAIERFDRYPQNNPIASLEAVCEALPVLPEVDVLLYGHAHAPPGPNGSVTVAQSVARLSLLRDGAPLIDKSILVYGDRRGGGAPEPFQRIPIGYDRALGGIGFADNPIGVGADPSQSGMPNFVDLRAPEERVACFGPIPPSFPARRQLLGSFGRHQLSQPVVEIPDDLDWRYFQSAPEEQRIEQLRGDETLLLEGVTEGVATIRTVLPSAQALLRIYPRDGGDAAEPIQMRPDLVQINTNRMVCTIVWRASIPLGSEAQAGTMVVAGALELPGQGARWPASAVELRIDDGGSSAPGAPSRSDLPLTDATVLMGDLGGVALPPPPPVPGSAAELEGTYVLTDGQAAAAAARPMAPFALSRPAPAPDDEALARTFPGAPWGKRKSTPDPRPLPPRDADTVSVDLELPAED